MSDDSSITDAAREAKLTEVLAKVGFDLEFVDGPL